VAKLKFLISKHVNFTKKHVNFAVSVFIEEINGKIYIVSIIAKATKSNKKQRKTTYKNQFFYLRV